MQDLSNTANTGDARTDMKPVQAFACNPKCLSIGELYGEQNALSGEWKEGLAASLIKEAVNDSSNSHKWIIFDGPVDAIWIENMNTVRRSAFLATWLRLIESIMLTEASKILYWMASCLQPLQLVIGEHS